MVQFLGSIITDEIKRNARGKVAQGLKCLSRLPVAYLEGTPLPGKYPIHKSGTAGEVLVTTDLGIKEEAEVEALCAIVEVRLQPREDSIDLVSKRDPVVVSRFVPHIHYTPSSAAREIAIGTCGMWSETDHLDVIGNGHFQKGYCEKGMHLWVVGATFRTSRKRASTRWVIVKSMNMQIGTKPSRTRNCRMPRLAYIAAKRSHGSPLRFPTTLVQLRIGGASAKKSEARRRNILIITDAPAKRK